MADFFEKHSVFGGGGAGLGRGNQSGFIEEAGEGFQEGLKFGHDLGAAFLDELGEAGVVVGVILGKFGQSKEHGEGVAQVVLGVSEGLEKGEKLLAGYRREGG